MIRIVSVALIAVSFAAQVHAAALQSLTIEEGETRTVELPGATTAYSLHPAIAQMTFVAPSARIVGRSGGIARIAVVSDAGVTTFDVEVKGSPRPSATDISDSSRSMIVESRYDSWSDRADQRIEYSTTNGDRETRTRIGIVANAISEGLDKDWLLPSLSWNLRTPSMSLTLFDEVVRVSPLIFSNQNLRGVHLATRGWEVHAGYSFYSMLGGLLIPKQRERVLGVGYEHQLAPGQSLSSDVYHFDSEESADEKGTIGSLTYRYGNGTSTRLLIETAASHSAAGSTLFGAAVDASHRDLDQDSSLRWRYRPAGFAGLRAQLAGTTADGSWRRRLTDAVTVAASAVHSDLEIGAGTQRSSSAGLTVAAKPYRSWTLHTGVRYGSVSTPLGLDSERIEVPVGITYGGSGWGASGEYRLARGTGHEELGTRARIAAHLRTGAFGGSISVERETNAPTLQLIFRERPDLALVLAELGLMVSSPYELAELLRNHPVLSEPGFLEGADIELTPEGLRGSLALDWVPGGAHSFRLNGQYRRDERISRTSELALASLSHSLSLGSNLELRTGYSRSFTRDPATQWIARGGWQVSIRKQLSDDGTGLPFLPSRGTVDGYVFADDDADGQHVEGGLGIPGVRVVLSEDERETRTDAKGYFRFERVSEGTHRVKAEYVSATPFRFTTASPVDVHAGGTVYFGIAPVAARLFGEVVSDAGIPLDGARIAVSGQGVDLSATVRGGRYSIEVPRSGRYEVRVDKTSVPPGYSLQALATRDVAIEMGEPHRVDFRAPALRSIAGRVERADTSGSPVRIAGATVRIADSDRMATTDDEGRFYFRDLTPIVTELIVEHDGVESRKELTVPNGPMLMRDMIVRLDGEPQTRTASTAQIKPREQVLPEVVDLPDPVRPVATVAAKETPRADAPPSSRRASAKPRRPAATVSVLRAPATIEAQPPSVTTYRLKGTFRGHEATDADASHSLRQEGHAHAVKTPATLELGAFASADRARQVVAAVTGYGYVGRVETRVGGFTVVVGPFADQATRERARRQLSMLTTAVTSTTAHISGSR